jgi:hypothetical protein
MLPSSLSSTSVGGHDAAIILFDPLNHFSIPCLASIMLSLLFSSILATGKSLDEDIKTTMKEVVKRSLLHLHIFRQQSWSALISTLHSLPDYLFDNTRHKSMHRRIHSLILDDIDAFVWSIRSTFPSLPTSTSTSNLLSTASTQLTTQLTKLVALLSCATLLTSHSSSNSPTTFRPHLPTIWPPGTHITRLAVRRVKVLKFAPAISIEEAEAERQQRWDVVIRARFECWKVGQGVRDGEGFVFSVGERGVEVESEERM